jgi:hypothetical protein
MPLPSGLKLWELPADGIEFSRSPITVYRYRIEGADLFQTIYFPALEIPVYRASITGDLLIVEAMTSIEPNQLAFWLVSVLKAFGLESRADAIWNASLPPVKQEFGKIVPVDDGLRKGMLFLLSQQHNVFSVGRFATWRNILLDDVVHDLRVVQEFVSKGFTGYQAAINNLTQKGST